MGNGIQVEIVGAGLEDFKAFAVSLQHPVFDTIMDHFDEMTGASRTTEQVSIGRCQRFEQGLDVIEDLLFAANHQAVADFEAPDAATGSGVHEVEALSSE